MLRINVHRLFLIFISIIFNFHNLYTSQTTELIPMKFYRKCYNSFNQQKSYYAESIIDGLVNTLGHRFEQNHSNTTPVRLKFTTKKSSHNRQPYDCLKVKVLAGTTILYKKRYSIEKSFQEKFELFTIES